MKLKSLVLALSLSASLPALAGQVDYYAGQQVEYPQIVIKYAKVYPQPRSGIKVIGADITDPQGNALSPKKLFTLSQTRSGDETDDPNGLNRFYAIDLPADKQKDPQYINQILDTISQLPQVELVYPAAKPVPLDNSNDGDGTGSAQGSKRTSARAEADPVDTTPDFTPLQSYLQGPEPIDNPAAPENLRSLAIGGINWQNVKDRPGAQGQGITIISNESVRWDEQHVDLPKAYQKFGIRYSIFDSTDYIRDVGGHDTSSVGIMAGKDNGFGVTGIANKARFGYAMDDPQALLKAGATLRAGDVVQVGIHTWNPFCKTDDTVCRERFVPIEVQAAWFSAIKALTDKGIIVVAAAGNGNENLDNPIYQGRFNTAVRDSGAILAGAFCSATGKKADFSNYGSRVTTSAWGCWNVVSTTTADSKIDKLYTAGGPHNQYTAKFAGTSSANPIVAGAAASLSGYAKSKNILLNSRQVRKILAETGTHLKGSGGRDDDSTIIGTQPDLVRAFEQVDKLSRQ